MSKNGVQPYNEGYCYYKGCNGYPLNYCKAFDLFTKAAELGNSDAMNYLGLMYENGEGTIQDAQKMVYWFNRSASLNDVWGLYNLGRCFGSGNGVVSDINKALELCLRSYSLEKNSSVGEYLGYIYYDLGNYRECAKYLLAVRDYVDNPNGLYIIGWLFESGHSSVTGIRDRQMMAMKYYEKSANKGVPEGMYAYGKLLLNIDKSQAGTARYWIKKAAQLGNADAKSLLKWINLQRFI